jgi:peptidoglycan/LPS O-acetylase OafA/YrhL
LRHPRFAMTTTPLARTAARSNPLDGVRALAALSVVSFHAWLYRVGDSPGKRTALFDKVLFEASIGLICFFVLSGFLLYRSFARAALTGREPVDIGRYAVRRAARIAPAYYACLVGCLLLYRAVGYSALVPSAEQLPLFAAFGQNYSVDTVMKINPVTWTLCVEISFYLLLPLLGIVAFRLGPKRVASQAAVLIGLVGVTIASNVLLHGTDGGALMSKALPTYIGFFAIGMLAALWIEWRDLIRGRPSALTPPGTAVLMGIGLACVGVHAYWHETAGSFTWAWKTFGNLPAAVGFALVIATAAHGTGAAVSWLSGRPLVALGVISYGIYLWHLPLLLAVRELGLLPVTFAPRLALVLALALGAAALSWILLERPIMRYAASRQRRRPGRQFVNVRRRVARAARSPQIIAVLRRANDQRAAADGRPTA